VQTFRDVVGLTVDGKLTTFSSIQCLTTAFNAALISHRQKMNHKLDFMVYDLRSITLNLLLQRDDAYDHFLVYILDDAKQTYGVEYSNSGKKVSIRFDSILATESIFFDSIRFANLINLPLLH